MIGLSEIEQAGVCIETEDPEPVIARMLAVSHQLSEELKGRGCVLGLWPDTVHNHNE